MFRSTVKTAVAAALAVGAFAASAEASIVDRDGVLLTTTGYDFGGEDWGIGSPMGAGDLHFHHDDGVIRPHLVGTLHLNDADGTCGRMRLEYFDAAGSRLSTNYGGAVCVTDDGHHEWDVDLDPYADNSIASVKVSLQKETATGWWTVESATYTPTPPDDLVKLTEDGVDFGGPGFEFGQPAAANGWGDKGQVDWSIANGVVSPRLKGYLHLNNSSGECARMNVRSLTESGTLLDSSAGGTVCASDNGHSYWYVEFTPYASTRIGQVTVQLQTLASNGAWITAGSDTVAIEE
jgi:hypothetical protein